MKMNAHESMPIRFENILFATDFSSISTIALPYAAAIARRFDSSVLVAHVILTESDSEISAEERETALARMRREAEERVMSLLSSSLFKGVPHQVIIVHGDLWPVLSSLAEEHDVDLVVMGTHARHGVRKLLSGSLAEEVFLQSMRPVLLVGPEVSVAPESELNIQNILYVTKLSPGCGPATHYSYALARAYKANLYFLHVIDNAWTEPLATRMSAEGYCRLRLLENGMPEKEKDVEPEFLVEFGSPETLALQAAAKKSAQLIVLDVPGSKYPDLLSHLPGPVAYNIATHARCPVLGIHAAPHHFRPET